MKRAGLAGDVLDDFCRSGPAARKDLNTRPMDSKTNKLIQQAGKYIQLGKLRHALEQYLKVYEFEPEETTIVNTIGDLYLRLGDEAEALRWYQKLAEILERRNLIAQTIAAYKKLLKLAPRDRHVMTRLAELYERQNLVSDAKAQYQLIAAEMMNEGSHDAAIAIYQKICKLDPASHEAQIHRAQALEQVGRAEEASQAYLLCAELLARKGDSPLAASVVENIFRLRPREKELVQWFFRILCEIRLTDHGVEYLRSLSLDRDADFQVLIGETLLQEGKLDLARDVLLNGGGGSRINPKVYPAALKLLQELIARKDLSAGLDTVATLFETSIERHDEITLRAALEALLALDESNIRTLKKLTALLIRMNDRQDLEKYLKRLVIRQMKAGDLQEARDHLNKLVVYAKNSDHVDLLNLLNEAMASGSPQDLARTCQIVVQFLETGTREQTDSEGETGMALGVSELDLGFAGSDSEDILVIDLPN